MAGEFARRITGAVAVQDVMGGIGLTVPTSVYDSTDETVRQFWILATQSGQRLMGEYEWQCLEREFTITTDGVTTDWDLPEDFDCFYSDSEWNRTTRLPMIGSLTTQEWAMMQARSLGGATFAVMYQLSDDKVKLYRAGDSGQTLVLPYKSRAWAVASDGTTYRDNLSLDTDIVRYDPQLYKSKLLLTWLMYKGFGTEGAVQDYNDLLTAAKSKDAPSRTLSLRRRAGVPLLTGLNVPDTGYGS